MFTSGWEIVQDTYERYAADGVVQLLLIAAIVVLLIKEKKNENKQMAYYAIALIAVVVFPPIVLVLTHFAGEDVYWRIFWLVPSVIIIAFAATRLIEQAGKRSKQRILFVGVLLVIVLGGKSVYNAETFNKAENLYKIPQEAIEICEMVAPDGGATKIIVPESIVSYIRQYNANINLLYGRNMGKDVQKGYRYKVLLQLNSAEPDVKYIAKKAKKKECEYIVFENFSSGTETIADYGYELFGSTQNYVIYKLVE
ncbi:hypothetical protein [Konateibacter massiliensis]|uniref:hypothetical protein n=1 Tax=Konateibacter massiliensis TaxID=2002841 RepID=UPI000C145570|nr:hypothetical protein [Konateibacter massiliensis]